jgi:hypothetical protein
MIAPSKLHPQYWPPVWSDPQLAAEAEDLAVEIPADDPFANILALAGDAAAPDHSLALARDIAAARIEQRRVRQVQDELSRNLPSQSFGQLWAWAKLIGKSSPARAMILAVGQQERRAFSHWKKAERAFDAVRHRHKRRVFRLMKRLKCRSDSHPNKEGAA